MAIQIAWKGVVGAAVVTGKVIVLAAKGVGAAAHWLGAHAAAVNVAAAGAAVTVALLDEEDIATWFAQHENLRTVGRKGVTILQAVGSPYKFFQGILDPRTGNYVDSRVIKAYALAPSVAAAHPVGQRVFHQ